MARVPRHRSPRLIWLYPGMYVKRWLGVLILGITLLSLGAGYLLRDIYANTPFPPLIYYLTLQFLDRTLRGLLLGSIGVSTIALGTWGLNRAILAPFLRPGQSDIAGTMLRHRQRQRGPKIVTIGGGTGHGTLLRGLKAYTDNITAIVTVGDDGGSSGELRRNLGLLPPGDFRQCIAALADAEGLMTRLFQYRFGTGQALGGHSFGNLFIAAMAGITGSFDQAIAESSRVLAVRGKVIPATLENVTLNADLREEPTTAAEIMAGPGWRRVQGESAIPQAGRAIERIFLEPENPHVHPDAVKAILDADLIVAGPGSLFTSVLPNLLVPGLAQAVLASPAVKVYVCNVATQRGETQGFNVADHVRALQAHVGPEMFRTVLANNRFDAELPAEAGITWAALPTGPTPGYIVVAADLLDLDKPWRHDSDKLARQLLDLYATQEAI